MRVCQFLALLLTYLMASQALALDARTQAALLEKLDDAAFADDKLEVLRPYAGKALPRSKPGRFLALLP